MDFFNWWKKLKLNIHLEQLFTKTRTYDRSVFGIEVAGGAQTE